MEKYNVEKEDLKWMVDNSVYPDQGYYILTQDERKNDYRQRNADTFSSGN